MMRLEKWLGGHRKTMWCVMLIILFFFTSPLLRVGIPFYIMAIVWMSFFDTMIFYFKYSMYYDIIRFTKVTRIDVLQMLENVLYTARNILGKLPFLLRSNNPQNVYWPYQELEYELFLCKKKRDKILTVFMHFFTWIKHYFTSWVFILFTLRTILFHFFGTYITNTFLMLYDAAIKFFKNFDYSTWLFSSLETLNNYTPLIILALSVLIIILYIRVKLKKQKYVLESYWNSPPPEKIELVAKNQKKIYKILYSLYGPVYENVELVHGLIRNIDISIKGKSYPFENKYIKMDRFSDYKKSIDDMHTLILEMQENDADDLYKQHNEKLYRELYALGINDPQPKKSFAYDVFSVTPDTIKNCLDEYEDCYNERTPKESTEYLRDVLYDRFIDGIIYLNMLQRYLRKSENRSRQYRRLRKAELKTEAMQKMVGD